MFGTSDSQTASGFFAGNRFPGRLLQKMATPRRQSARLQANGAREQPVVIDSSDDEDEGFFSSESEELEEPEPRRARRKRPRTATNNGTPRRARAADVANGGRRIVGQFKFLELDDAIRDMVLAFLEPRDLLRLSWTSSSMAKTLMARKAATIWATARKSTILPGDISIPDCPEDISELRWAHLLFGPTQCFTCGAPNISAIIFPFRRRACVACMKANMLFEKKFHAQFKDQSDAILKLLPHSNSGPWAHGRSSNSKFYWTPDVEKAIARQAELAKEVADGKPDAAANLKRWKADRMLEADTIVLESKDHDCWINRRDKGRDSAGDDTRLQRKMLVEAKLLEDGWDMDDITKLAYMPKTTPAKADLTAAAWTRIRKEVEPTLLTFRSRRLFEEELVALGWTKEEVTPYRYTPSYEGEKITPAEWAKTWTDIGPHFLRVRSKRLFEAKLAEFGWGKKAIASVQYSPLYAMPEITDEDWMDTWDEIEPQIRKLRYRSLGAKLENIYGEYCDSLPPDRWRTLPTIEDVSRFPMVLSVMSSREAAFRPVQAADLAKVAEQLPHLIDAWLARAKARLADGVFLPSMNLDGQMVWSEAEPKHLDLAIAVYTCETSWESCSTVVQRVENVLVGAQRLPFIGVEDALAHERLHAGSYMVEFDRSAARPPSKVKFNRRGSIAALALLQRLSLDPQKTGPRDLDNRDARFRCAHCAVLHPDTLGRVIMDWRRSIAHFIASSEKDHAHPCWTMLEPAAATSARQLAHLGACGAHSAHVWACNRCDFEAQRVGDMILHMVQRHQSPNARENKEFTSASSCQWPMEPITLVGGTPLVRAGAPPPQAARPPPQVPSRTPQGPARTLPLAPNPRDPLSIPPSPPGAVPYARPVAAPQGQPEQRYLCNHCPSILRNFALHGVCEHIKAKHKIMEPTNGKDFRAHGFRVAQRAGF